MKVTECVVASCLSLIEAAHGYKNTYIHCLDSIEDKP
jgi:hypothetical protein